VLGIGAMLTDFNSGALTARGDRSESINIMQQSVRVGNAIYNNVGVRDVLGALARKLPRKDLKAPRVHGLGEPIGKPSDEITVDYLYPTPSMGLAFAKMPKGSTFQNQTLWGSIGWASPAAFGAALCAPNPNRRTILVTGEGVASIDGAGGQPIPTLWSQADHLRSQQRWLSDRAAALQRFRKLLQRPRTMAMPQAC
jgi:indolepyruvate decarboxylase